MYTQLALGSDVHRYAGNSEGFFALFVALVILAGAITIRCWTAMDVAALPVVPQWIDRVVGAFFLVVAFFLTVGLHLPGLVDALADNPTSTEYLADPNVFWLVKFMDLAIVVPVLVVNGLGVLWAAPWVGKVKYAAVGWAALLGASVAGMAVAMQLAGDPAATATNTVAFTTFAILAGCIAWLLYGPLASRETASPNQERELAE